MSRTVKIRIYRIIIIQQKQLSKIKNMRIKVLRNKLEEWLWIVVKKNEQGSNGYVWKIKHGVNGSDAY